MPTLSFEAESHDELVRKVRRWLASVDGEDHLTPVEAVEKARDLDHVSCAARARELYSPDAMVDRYLEVYADFIGAAGGAHEVSPATKARGKRAPRQSSAAGAARPRGGDRRLQPERRRGLFAP